MIVDFHTHIFPPEVAGQRNEYVRRDPTFGEMYADPKAKLASAEQLLASMDAAGVDVSVALGFAWRERELIVRHNDYLLDAAAASGGRIVAFTTANMADARAEEEIERCAAAGARGLGELRPENQGWELNGAAGERLAAAARRLDLVPLFHVTEPGERAYPGRHGCALPSFRAFADRHASEVMIVGGHLGGGIYAEPPKRDPDVYVDTAAQPFLYPAQAAMDAILASPEERLLFGSDWPLIDQKRQLDELRREIAGEHSLAAALGGNAERLLGLRG